MTDILFSCGKAAPLLHVAQPMISISFISSRIWSNRVGSRGFVRDRRPSLLQPRNVFFWPSICLLWKPGYCSSLDDDGSVNRHGIMSHAHELNYQPRLFGPRGERAICWLMLIG